jgi:paraquat-inducible protein A
MGCPTCGLHQEVPTLGEREHADCARCHDPLVESLPSMPSKAAAFALTGLIFLIPGELWPLLLFDFSGQWCVNLVSTGAVQLWKQGDPVSGAMVLFTTLIAPVAFNVTILTAVAGLKFGWFPRLTRRLWVMLLELGEWSMLDVYLLALGIASIKLLGMGDVQTQPGLWFIFAYVLASGLAAGAIRPPLVRHLLRSIGDGPPPIPPGTGAQTCRHCGTLSGGELTHCPACTSSLSHPDVNAMRRRVMGLLIAATVLWFPANLLPVMTLSVVAQKDILTVMGGVEYLWHHGDMVPAVIIFIASVIVPVTKIVTLYVLYYLSHKPRSPALLTRVFQWVKCIGRWSMVDILVLSVLAALGQLGVAATVEPGPGALPFCAVVVLTMFSANSMQSDIFWKNPTKPANS